MKKKTVFLCVAAMLLTLLGGCKGDGPAVSTPEENSSVSSSSTSATTTTTVSTTEGSATTSSVTNDTKSQPTATKTPTVSSSTVSRNTVSVAPPSTTTKPGTSTTPPSSGTTRTTGTTGTVHRSDEAFPAFDGTIAIYPVSRECFDLFLADPYYSVIESGCAHPYTYPQNGEWYNKFSGGRLSIQNALINFAGQSAALQEYLTNKGVKATVERALLLEAPDVPLTIWVKTDKEPVFITVNETSTPNNGTYVYRRYTAATYRKKFGRLDGQLVINGKSIDLPQPIKIYASSAILPLTTVLKELGATIEPSGDTVRTIVFQGKTYVLNLSEKSFTATEVNKGNLLHIDGGWSIMYAENGELMVNDAILRYVLNEIGANNRITIDRESETVTIK